MIRSMTGFGRGETVTQDAKITVEIKAVNHRYCDLNIKMPRKLNYLEIKMRNYIKKSIQRGKVDVFISYEDLADRENLVRCNLDIARGYYEAITQISGALQIGNRATAYEISRFPEVVTLEDSQVNPEGMEQQLTDTLEQALMQFSDSRETEGENLQKDILSKLHVMGENVREIEERYPQMLHDYRTRLQNKLTEILEDSDIDENRLAAEVVIYADKICVDEETVRLRSHMKAMEEEILKGGSVGRKLDFIAQEMNREANTILSKANDVQISNIGIQLKTDIEKIREQVQNIE